MFCDICLAHPTVTGHQMTRIGTAGEEWYLDTQEPNMLSSTDPWKTDVPASEGCFEYGEGEQDQDNNLEEPDMSCPSENPQRQKRKRRAHKKGTQARKLQRNHDRGRLNSVDRDKIHESMKTVGGYIQVGNEGVFALFDHSASHSFISSKLVEELKLEKLPTRRPLIVYTPEGEVLADQVCKNVSLTINGERFTASLIILESMDIPMVFGNGWLCAHKGVIQGNQQLCS